MRVVALTATGAALFGGLLLVAVAARPALRLDMRPGGELDRTIAAGFHDPEIDPYGLTYRWTSRRATLRLPGLDRRIDWRLRVRVRASRAPSEVRPDFGIDVDGETRQRAPAPGDYTEVAVDVPRRDPAPRVTRIDLVTSAVVVPGGHDDRELGAQIDWLTLEPASGAWPLPPVRPLLQAMACGALLGLAVGLLQWPRAAGFAVLVVAAGLDVALLMRGAAMFLPFPAINVNIAAAVTSIALAALAIARRASRSALSMEARLALGAWTVVTWVKVALILHPAMAIGDMGFHRNRLTLVQRGAWFFTSDAPGGEFPYPPAYYLLVSWIDGWVRDPALLLRLVMVGADAALCGLAYPVLVRAGVDRARAAASVLALLLTPALFQIQAVAFLTNAFGNTVAALALLALVTPAAGALAAWQLIAGLVLTFVALLSHLSPAFILGAALGFLGLRHLLVGLFARQRLVLRNGVLVLLLAAVAAGAAFAVYYVKFLPVFQTAWARTGAARSASVNPDATPPRQRPEPHQTMFVPGRAALVSRLLATPRYAAGAYGAPMLLLAAWGAIVAWRRGRDGLPGLLGPWLAACLAFLTLAMVTPIDMRYYLAAAPAFALLAGIGLADLARPSLPGRPVLGRIVASVLGTWLVVHGLLYDFSWLG